MAVDEAVQTTGRPPVGPAEGDTFGWLDEDDELLADADADDYDQDEVEGGVDLRRRRSISLDAILGTSLVHELPETGERIVIGRGWPRRRSANSSPLGRKSARHARRPSSSLAGAAVRVLQSDRKRHRPISDEQKRRLLVEFFARTGQGAQRLAVGPRGPKGPKTESKGRRPSVRQLLVRYDLPRHSGAPIALA